MSKPESGITHITKRFVFAVSAALLVYWSLKVHRDWVWAYFESVMILPPGSDQAALSVVATASISALTTAFIASSTTIAFIAGFLITGNVAALRGMFKWSSQAEAVGETISSTIHEHLTQKSEVDERLVQEFAEKYKDDPSYIREEQLQ